MKWLLILSIVLSWEYAVAYEARYAERYYINNNSVLFYKIINWWYDCLPEESKQLCGSRIKYQNIGNAKVKHNEPQTLLEIRIQGGFTEQLIIFKQCEGCFGPSYLKCTWLNKKYFGNGAAMNISKDFTTTSIVRIKNVNETYGRLIQSIEHDMTFELEGVISGLLNGKIALHQGESFLKNCPGPIDRRGKNFPISFTIINSLTKEVLAQYTAIWEH